MKLIEASMKVDAMTQGCSITCSEVESYRMDKTGIMMNDENVVIEAVVIGTRRIHYICDALTNCLVMLARCKHN
jgi:hypothetical protein